MENSAPALAALVFLTKGFTVPVADAIGRLISNPINQWAASNQISILERGKGRYKLNKQGEIVANPKLVLRIMHEGGFEGDVDMQDLWAGLLASSIDDSNLQHVETLKSLTKAQALIVSALCKSVSIKQNNAGLLYSDDEKFLDTKYLFDVSGISNLDTLDQALDDLRRKELIDGGFDVHDAATVGKARIVISPLALHFYARAMGNADSIDFYKKRIKKSNNTKAINVKA